MKQFLQDLLILAINYFATVLLLNATPIEGCTYAMAALCAAKLNSLLEEKK